jgi:hypothetical protein
MDEEPQVSWRSSVPGEHLSVICWLGFQAVSGLSVRHLADELANCGQETPFLLMLPIVPS